jgi:hypothetical protein
LFRRTKLTLSCSAEGKEGRSFNLKMQVIHFKENQYFRTNLYFMSYTDSLLYKPPLKVRFNRRLKCWLQ